MNAPWKNAHPLLKINDGRLVGSLFGLSPSTTYFIQVSDGINAISGSTTTQPDSLQFTPSAILYVNAKAAAGGNGSAAAPFQTIQAAVNHAALAHRYWLQTVHMLRQWHSPPPVQPITGSR